MAGSPEKIQDVWGSDLEVRKYKECVTALIETGEYGFHKRRSNSAPAEECGHHPHIHHMLSQLLNHLKSQPLETSKRENLQAPLYDWPRRCPHDLGFGTHAKKDVDSSQPKMRETSSTERKRKKHQHSSELTLPTESEYVLSAQSLGKPAALPSTTENEGVVTSCKRIKLSPPEIKKFHYNNVFEPLAYFRNTNGRSGDLADTSDHLTLDSDPPAEGIDGESRERKTPSENGKATKMETSSRNFLARYNGPANNFPDYSPPVIQASVALVPTVGKVMAGEKKAASVLGSFRPINNLKNSDNNSSALPRPRQKKVFDLHEDNSARASDEPRAAKRQKTGTENLIRRESSSSLIEIPKDSNLFGTGHQISSTNPTPKKTIQSVSSRWHYQNHHFTSRLGEVDEYNRTEAIVGFAPAKKRKAVLSGLERRSSFRGETERDSTQRRISLISEPPISAKGKLPGSVNGVGHTQILVDDLESEEVVDLSQTPRAPQGRVRDGTPRPTAHKNLAGVEKSEYFTTPEKRSEARNCVPRLAVHSSSSEVTVEDLEREEISSPSSSHGLGEAIEESQSLEDDSTDLVNPDDDPSRLDQKAKGGDRITKKNMKHFISPKSKSISDEGDIPKSAFSGVKAKNNEGYSSRKLRPELSFKITYMQSGQKGFEVADDCEPWELHYDHEKKEFGVIAKHEPLHELFPSLVLKPEKIHIVKYSNDSLKVVIARAMETSIGALAQVLLKMDKLDDGNRLAQSLKQLNHTIRLLPQGSGEQLDNIFSMTIRSTPLPRYQSKDIALLIAKEARRATSNEKVREDLVGSKNTPTEEGSQTASTGRRRSSTARHDNLVLTRRQSIANRMLPSSLSDGPVLSCTPKVELPLKIEILSSRKVSTSNREDFYGSRPATRAFSGQQNGGRKHEAFKLRPPGPVRWTAENPSWKEAWLWEASLTFPREGKKKATVDARDIERLDEGEFLNDNLIAFYLRYLEDRLERSRPELARRIYFHNTFFYETLTKGRVRSNNINYDAVKRWTSKVDLFIYDYIVVPVCEKLHWYVAIICNAPKLLQPETRDVLEAAETDEHATLPSKAPPSHYQERKDDNGASNTLDISNDATVYRSTSPSVIAQVEHMSLEDQEQEWPEPDVVPELPRARISQLRSLHATDEHSNDLIEGDEHQGKTEDLRPKGRRLKRRSIPPPQKYDPSEPRIITLDSLGQAHSPTCSNLKEYLVCEAKERRNIHIAPGRLGMTAKGLPQQSNYCDCGVFVLGYIENFLENPDEFVYKILQGDMTEKKAAFKIGAPQMRQWIRELIFRIHAEQNQEAAARHEAGSNAKKASGTEFQPLVSRKLLASTLRLANVKSSVANDKKAELNDSGLIEPFMQPAAPKLTGKLRDGMRAKNPESRQHSSTATNGHESWPVEEIEPRSTSKLRAETRHFLKNVTTPILETDDAEIMETPVPSIEDERTQAIERSRSRDNCYLSSPNSTDTSILLDSPLRPALSEGNAQTSPTRKTEAEFRTHNTFKLLAKSPNSSFQSTRGKGQPIKAPEQNLLETNDSEDGYHLEVGESPPRQVEQEPPLEDIPELPAKPRKSRTLVLDADHSPEPELVSISQIIKRKGRR